MTLKMTGPSKRDDSSHFQYRSKIPADLADAMRRRILRFELPEFRAGKATTVTVTVKVGSHLKVSLRTRDPGSAKLRTTVLSAAIDKVFETERSGPVKLTHKEAVALSKGAYDLTTPLIFSGTQICRNPYGYHWDEGIFAVVTVDEASWQVD